MYNKCVEFCLRLSTAIKSTAGKYILQEKNLISIYMLPF